MKKTKLLAAGVLVLLMAGAVNSIAILIRGKAFTDAGIMKSVADAPSPWMAAYEADPLTDLSTAVPDRGGLLAAIAAFESDGSVSADMPRLLQVYQALQGDGDGADPWYLFYEALARLILADDKGFQALSRRLFSMDAVTGDELNWMGARLDRCGFHEAAWAYFEGSIQESVREGASLDANAALLYNPLFNPLRSLKTLMAEGKTDIASARLNALVKMNPRIENMYWIYLQMAEYYAGEGMEALARDFKKLAGMQFGESISFPARLIARGDATLNALAVALFGFVVYLAALWFKFRRRARFRNSRPGGGRSLVSGMRLPGRCLEPVAFVFLLAVAGIVLGCSMNLGAIFSAIGRGASIPVNFGSGRYDTAESKQLMETLTDACGGRPDFDRFHAYVLLKTGDDDGARNLLEKTLEERPDDISALVNRAVMAHREGDTALARRLIRRAVALAPSCLEAVHNYRIITGQGTAFPEWFEALKASETLSATLRIVCSHFDDIWPDTAALIFDSPQDPLVMSDRGQFLREWTRQPLTFSSRMARVLDFTGMLNCVRLWGASHRMAGTGLWAGFLLIVVCFCVAYLRGGGRGDGRCLKCGDVVCEIPGMEPPEGGASAPLLCRKCTAEARYGDTGFLAGRARKVWLRWIPFAGGFLAGRVVGATMALMLFLYCLVSLVFTHSSIWGVHGAQGVLSAIAVPQMTFTPLPATLSLHDAALRSVLFVIGMVAGILLAMVAGRPTVPER